MEKLEAELIRKLQNTQAIQKEAYQDLEKALKEPSAMMAPYVKQGGVPPARVGGAPPQWEYPLVCFARVISPA